MLLLLLVCSLLWFASLTSLTIPCSLAQWNPILGNLRRKICWISTHWTAVRLLLWPLEEVGPHCCVVDKEVLVVGKVCWLFLCCRQNRSVFSFRTSKRNSTQGEYPDDACVVRTPQHTHARHANSTRSPQRLLVSFPRPRYRCHPLPHTLPYVQNWVLLVFSTPQSFPPTGCWFWQIPPPLESFACIGTMVFPLPSHQNNTRVGHDTTRSSRSRCPVLRCNRA